LRVFSGESQECGGQTNPGGFSSVKLKAGVLDEVSHIRYIDQEDDALRIAGTRVGLSSIVAALQEGESPEKIADEFPTVTVAQVNGAIAYYLENQKLMDEFFAEVDHEFFRQVRPLSETNPELFARLEVARQHPKRP